ncbi:MAG: hypothetical protein H0W84_01330 [Bacteroidetes bacterium]|nr:hypothetical protein [Bacteroidota bacterium]
MEQIELDLTELIEEGKTDSISGRTFGQGYAKKVKLLENIDKGLSFKVVIPPSKIKAINDSFIKGFFSNVFEKYKKKEKVKQFFTFETDDFYKSLIEKNLSILDSIYNV